MKILFVSALLPFPLHSGGQVRVYNLLKRLGKKNEVSLFSFLRKKEEKRYESEFSFCKKVITAYRGRAWQGRYVAKSIFSSYPLLFATYENEILRDQIAQELSRERYDLVHIEPSYVWPVLPQVNIPLVVCEHNIEYLGYRGYVERFAFVPLRPLLSVDVAKLFLWERNVWKKASRVVAVSDEDRRIIEKTIGSKVDVVPNGVDLTQFPYKPKPNTSPVFLFVGYFGWLQNRDAIKYLVDDIWPLLKRKYPRSVLRIIGRQAPEDLKEKIQKADAELIEGVEDIAGQYQKANYLVAPIRIGSGSRYKILEAMASGLPVVTTASGAAGLYVNDTHEVMQAQTPEQFVRAVEILVSDPELRNRVVKAARVRIETSFSWEIIAKELEKVWEQACQK